jgi:hypothetical protein
MRRSVLRALLLAVMCLACAAQNQTANDVSRVLSLENIWNEAESKHNVGAMRMLLADNFKYTDDDGSSMTKTLFLAHVENGVDQYDQLSNSGVSVDLYGDAAVATGEYRETLRQKGKKVLRSGRFTDVWIQRNGQWLCVASQSTLISH